MTPLPPEVNAFGGGFKRTNQGGFQLSDKSSPAIGLDQGSYSRQQFYGSIAPARGVATHDPVAQSCIRQICRRYRLEPQQCEWLAGKRS